MAVHKDCYSAIDLTKQDGAHRSETRAAAGGADEFLRRVGTAWSTAQPEERVRQEITIEAEPQVRALPHDRFCARTRLTK